VSAYAPKLNVVGSVGLNAASGPGAIVGICGYNNATNMNACPTADYAWQDLFDVGANYLNKFGDFTVALYGAFAYASFAAGLRLGSAACSRTSRPTRSPGRTWTRGSSGWSVRSSASPASRSVAPSLRQQRPRLELLHRRRQRHPKSISTLPFFLTIPISRMTRIIAITQKSTDRSSLPLLAQTGPPGGSAIRSLSGAKQTLSKPPSKFDLRVHAP